ncbi:MAG: 3'-5' exonuclease [Candidatus Paceibacterota bacterium]|jgi:DNA polymerase-3 subunit epsilon
MADIKKQKLAFLDTETTGLNPDKHELIEIGCVIVEQDWTGDDKKPTFEIVEEIEIKIKPEHIEDADPVALRVNHYDPVDWVFAYTLPEAMKILSEKTKGAIMVGHNICFDNGFIEHAFRISGVDNTMHYHKLDTISIAFAKLHNHEDIDKFSLHALGEYFNIENKHAHSALSDARATFELYEKLMRI